MSNKYWVKRGEFANQYSLCYTISQEQEAQAEDEGWERITWKEAKLLCRQERERRRNDYAFSGYADTHVFPFGIPDDQLRFDPYSGDIIVPRPMRHVI